MSEPGESVRETLQRVVEASESPVRTAPPPPVTRDTREPPASVPTATENYVDRHQSESGTERDQTEPGTVTGSEKRSDRPRDEFGRYTKTSEGPPSEPPAPEPSDKSPPISEIPDQPEPAAHEEATPIAAPQAWSAAAKETWHQLPRAIKEEIDRRERDVSRHLQQRAEQLNTLEPLAQALAPYQQKLALRGIHPAAAVQQLLTVQDLLDRDPLEGVAYVAKTYGVDLRQFATAFAQAQQPQDPVVRQAQDRIGRLEQMLQTWQQGAEQQEMARINAEVQQFAANTRDYPYYEQVRERMAQLMQTGAASTLVQAYRLACADNDDVTRAMAQAQDWAKRQQRQTQERQAADRARRAAVSVSGSPGGGYAGAGQLKNGSVRDAIESAYDQVATR